MLDHTTLTTGLGGEEDGRWRGGEGLADQSLVLGGGGEGGGEEEFRGRNAEATVGRELKEGKK